MPGIKTLKRVAVAASIAALSACASDPGTSSTTTTTPYPSAPATAQFGRVTNVELVSTQQQQQPSSGIGGAVIGGVVGGLLGHQVGGGSGQDIATVAGVVGGALIGRAIQRNQAPPPTVSQLYRVTVQQDNGAVRAFDYAEQPNVRVGDRVRIENDQVYR